MIARNNYIPQQILSIWKKRKKKIKRERERICLSRFIFERDRENLLLKVYFQSAAVVYQKQNVSSESRYRTWSDFPFEILTRFIITSVQESIKKTKIIQQSSISLTRRLLVKGSENAPPCWNWLVDIGSFLETFTFCTRTLLPYFQ